jgi:hypothetical protein
MQQPPPTCSRSALPTTCTARHQEPWWVLCAGCCVAWGCPFPVLACSRKARACGATPLAACLPTPAQTQASGGPQYPSAPGGAYPAPFNARSGSGPLPPPAHVSAACACWGWKGGCVCRSAL